MPKFKSYGFEIEVDDDSVVRIIQPQHGGHDPDSVVILDFEEVDILRRWLAQIVSEGGS